MAECVFCKIIVGEIAAPKIYENDEVIAINDINPVANVHVLIISKRHYGSILSEGIEGSGLLDGVLRAAREIAKIKGISESGFRLVSNCGEDGGQSVPHLHFHIIGGQRLGARVI